MCCEFRVLFSEGQPDRRDRGQISTERDEGRSGQAERCQGKCAGTRGQETSALFLPLPEINSVILGHIFEP